MGKSEKHVGKSLHFMHSPINESHREKIALSLTVHAHVPINRPQNCHMRRESLPTAFYPHILRQDAINHQMVATTAAQEGHLIYHS